MKLLSYINLLFFKEFGLSYQAPPHVSTLYVHLSHPCDIFLSHRQKAFKDLQIYRLNVISFENGLKFGHLKSKMQKAPDFLN